MRIILLIGFLIAFAIRIDAQTFSIKTYKGQSITGKLESIDRGAIFLKSNKDSALYQINFVDVLQIEIPGRPFTFDDQIVKINDDQVLCEVLGANTFDVFISTPQMSLTSIPMEKVRIIQADTFYFNLKSSYSSYEKKDTIILNSNDLMAINSSGFHLNKSANQHLFSFAFIALAVPLSFVSPIAVGAAGLIGLGLQMSAFVEQKKAAKELLNLKSEKP
jgi:hypothetical protein